MKTAYNSTYYNISLLKLVVKICFDLLHACYVSLHFVTTHKQRCFFLLELVVVGADFLLETLDRFLTVFISLFHFLQNQNIIH